MTHLSDVLNAMTVDLEEYFQVSLFERHAPPASWETFPRRAAQSVHRLLELFARRGVTATFFTLGWVAEREPALLREIAAAGHEIASHGHLHREIHAMSPAEFRADLARARDAIGEACGVRVVGFRAPSWSIGPRTRWALEVLAAEGYRFDSSIFPVRHDRYGWPGAPRAPYVIQTAAGAIVEAPPATARLFGANVGVAGGGWLRHLPFALIRAGLGSMAKERLPAVLYVHPWEIDAEQPRLAVGAATAFRHYRNLDRVLARLDALLAAAKFGTVSAMLEAYAASPARDGAAAAAATTATTTEAA